MSRFLRFLLVVVALDTGALAEAQQPGKMPRIGYLSHRAGPSGADKAFRQALRDLGWIDVEGQNIVIEARFAEGKFDRFPRFEAELVRQRSNDVNFESRNTFRPSVRPHISLSASL